jgi:hypothetical protein
MTGNILMIEKSTKNDKGMFICRASNVYGYEEVSLTVAVYSANFLASIFS